MRIVFFGTPGLAVPSLAAAAQSHELVALVCQPDRPKGRGKKLEPPPAKVWAEKHHVPVAQPEKLNDGAFEAWLRAQAPDICLIAAYGRILRQPIL
ncbi:MAG TPA: formyltransferase family protein, partial [Candidatus Hydrogenedentes bacterium]|nr:formyltransferase family protein [Candidatus Hydrogenedentota bacterium]